MYGKCRGIFHTWSIWALQLDHLFSVSTPVTWPPETSSIAWALSQSVSCLPRSVTLGISYGNYEKPMKNPVFIMHIVDEQLKN